MRALTREAFTPFGQVIGTRGARHYPINDGTTTRFHDLAKVELAGWRAHPLISIFRGRPFAPPIRVAMLERHPLGSQAFMPLSARPFVAVVAGDEDGRPGRPSAFLVGPDAGGLRGVNYARNVWHHPLIALEGESDFLVVDRDGEGDNLETFAFDQPYVIDSLDLS
ncbi:MAG: ureidoglycolate lyase [Alphaproteobacteria bacterium]|nr:MAG: ureidoglycolate lyase [Alphaproteobacteria bacterium]